MRAELSEIELTEIYGMLDGVLKILSRAEGREAGYAARRDAFRVLEFPRQKGDTLGESATQDTLIEEVKAMLISLNLKGSVRVRSGGLIEFRSVPIGSVYGRSKEELQEKLEKRLRRLKSHQPPPKKKPRTPLLSEFYEKNYFPYKKAQERAAQTLKNYGYAISYIVKAGFDKRLDAYTPALVEEFLLSIPQTRKRQIQQGFLNNMFKRAVALGVVKSNPVAPIEKMKHKQETGRAFSFTEQGAFFDELLEAQMSDLKKLYFVFIYLTGARRKEALAVEVTDVDRKEKVLHIPGTKTYGSNRDIPLFPLVEKLLDRTGVKEGRFFPFSPEAMDRAFRKVESGHKLHDLRHTFGTIKIFCDKLDAKTVSLWLGHSGIETTLKIYTHPDELDKGLFLRGDLSEEEKTAILKAKRAEIERKIEASFLSVPNSVPKIGEKNDENAPRE